MDILSQIRKPVAEDLARYERLFDSVLDHEDDFLGRALQYVRSRKGKMMRPLLVLLIARECGAVRKKALHSAVTLELLHTASLVHDDVVDESNERRGQASGGAGCGGRRAVGGGGRAVGGRPPRQVLGPVGRLHQTVHKNTYLLRMGIPAPARHRSIVRYSARAASTRRRTSCPISSMLRIPSPQVQGTVCQPR